MTLAKYTEEQRANKQSKTPSESPVEDTKGTSLKKVLTNIKKRALKVLQSPKKKQTNTDVK